MATIKDIADEVGISKASVSRILNKKGSFSADTIDRVIRAAEKLNYSLPMNGAREESIENMKNVALIMPPKYSSYYGVLSAFLEQEAYSYGLNLILCTSIYNCIESDSKFERWLKDHKIAGAIMAVFTRQSDLFTKMGIPVVSVGYDADKKYPVVRADNIAAGNIAAKHLIARGSQRLLYISNYPLGLEKDLRYKGFLEEALRQQVSVTPCFLKITTDHLHEAAGKITQLLLAHPQADGIFIESASITSICQRVCTELGLDISRQIRLIGYGTEAQMQCCNVPLTYVQENIQTIARTAVSLLDDMITYKDPVDNKICEPILIPVSLFFGTTT